jgi:cytidylate kinase
VKEGRIIAISREFGSGGSEIGRRLAERLGIPYYDKEYVEAVLKESGLSTEIIEREEQKFINSLLYNLATGGNRRSTDKAKADEVYAAESDALKAVAAQGSCVIVGCCADHILKDDFDVFSVFVHAPIKTRVERAIERGGIAARRAAATVKERDRARARHYEYYTDKSWGNCDNYHLTVNSGCFGVDGAVEFIKRALELV